MGKGARVPAPHDDIPAPPWRTPRKVRPSRQPLDQEQIVNAAMAILDSDGLDAVSMRRVAQELGTGPASLYAHVSNKQELFELMLDRVGANVSVPEPDPTRWRQQIKDMARQLHKAFTEHSDIAFVALATIPTGPNVLRASEGMLAIMFAGGVPARAATWFLDRLFLYVAADAYEDSLHLVKQRASGKDAQTYFKDFVGQVWTFYESLSPHQFPHLTSNLDTLMYGGESGQRFEFGLDLLIDGLAAQSDRG